MNVELNLKLEQMTEMTKNESEEDTTERPVVNLNLNLLLINVQLKLQQMTEGKRAKMKKSLPQVPTKRSSSMDSTMLSVVSFFYEKLKVLVF